MVWDEEGTSSTELVLVMPAVLFMVLLAVQFGLYLHAAQVVEAAAQEGLEAARGEVATVAEGRTRAAGFIASTGGVHSPEVTAARSADTATVTVTGAAPQVVPGLWLQVSSVASGPVERFIPEPQRGI
ncbi:MAG: pilus assembly protein TadE [Micromonosporaceae bacterium]|nr:pilus assembly protein TadE [Micromonosporaceae bacterium]